MAQKALANSYHLRRASGADLACSSLKTNTILRAMKNRAQNRHSTTISNPRWLAYAAAGAATSLGWAGSAEAEIHYSGIVNFTFADGSQFKSFRLTNRVGLQFSRFTYFPFGSAGDLVSIAGARRSHQVRADSRNDYFAEKLSFGQQVSTGLFNSHFFQRAMVSLYGDGQFNGPGEAFVAFRFDDGRGKQYGWARVQMGKAPKHKFILKDYAYSDVGDRIRAGQKSSDEMVPEESDDMVPEEGSLGALTLGAAGLLAWRKRRSQAAS
jgi:hypothetical protein